MQNERKFPAHHCLFQCAIYCSTPEHFAKKLRQTLLHIFQSHHGNVSVREFFICVDVLKTKNKAFEKGKSLLERHKRLRIQSIYFEFFEDSCVHDWRNLSSHSGGQCRPRIHAAIYNHQILPKILLGRDRNIFEFSDRYSPGISRVYHFERLLNRRIKIFIYHLALLHLQGNLRLLSPTTETSRISSLFFQSLWFLRFLLPTLSQVWRKSPQLILIQRTILFHHYEGTFEKVQNQRMSSRRSLPHEKKHRQPSLTLHLFNPQTGQVNPQQPRSLNPIRILETLRR